MYQVARKKGRLASKRLIRWISNSYDLEIQNRRWFIIIILPIHVLLLSIRFLSQWKGWDCSSYAGPVRVGNILKMVTVAELQSYLNLEIASAHLLLFILLLKSNTTPAAAYKTLNRRIVCCSAQFWCYLYGLNRPCGLKYVVLITYFVMQLIEVYNPITF